MFPRLSMQPRVSAAIKAATLVVSLSLVGTVSAEQTIIHKEQVLQQVRQLLEKDQASLSELQQSAQLLQKTFDEFPDDATIPIYLARAYYRMGDPEADIDQQYGYYSKAGIYAEKAIEIAPQRAEGHYWYGLYLLKKAQKIGGLQAFFIVRDGIRELEIVRQIMPQYDQAGASRVLGQLHCRAPEWTPFGNIDKCIQLAKESVQIAPNHPLNRLYLADAYNKYGDREAAIQQYQELLASIAHLPDEERKEFCQRAIDQLKSLGVKSDTNTKAFKN